MYIRKARLVHLPCFMIEIKSQSLSFKAVAPPVQRDWEPTEVLSGDALAVEAKSCHCAPDLTLHHARCGVITLCETKVR